jgi:metallophosphoesterase (TIGR00282 family)
LRILFIGEIIGKPGRQAVSLLLPRLREELSPDFIAANCENAAGGSGITKDTAGEILAAGVDVITLGDHVWSKKESYPYLDEETRVVRPANYPSGAPGRGWGVYTVPSGVRVGVINLCGRIFLDPLDHPFRAADSILETLAPASDVILVDFHAEATSEKTAFAYYVDGRVSAVVGTHTHVQTADERILPGGTAYITDAGMTGPVDSVLGMNKELAIARFVTQMPGKFEVAEGETALSAVIIDVESSSGRAVRIERLRRSCSEAE